MKTTCETNTHTRTHTHTHTHTHILGQFTSKRAFWQRTPVADLGLGKGGLRLAWVNATPTFMVGHVNF